MNKMTSERKDPTSFLPEEPMSYEIKPKKKKKKKKNKDYDPFGDIVEKPLVTTRVLDSEVNNDVVDVQDEIDNGPLAIDPEVNIKVEDFEVDLNFNDFMNETGLTLGEQRNEEHEEPEIKLEPQNHDAVLLTFEFDNILAEKKDLDKIGFPQPAEVQPHCSQEDNDRVICQICYLSFSTSRTLKFHQQRKHKIMRKSFVHHCNLCGASYDNTNSLFCHKKRRHGPDVLPDDDEEKVCEVCSLVFKGKTRIRLHMFRRHGYFKDSFKHACDECDLVYEKPNSLVIHMQRKHPKTEIKTSEQWFRCVFCPKVFLKKDSLVRHVQRKHDSDDYCDPIPSQEFIEQHTNESGQLVCLQCSLVFSSVHFLKLHMRRQHNELKEIFNLKCRICNLSYDKIESLKKHVRRCHNSDLYCKVCNKQFYRKEAYMNHSHQKTVKECSMCNQIYPTNRGLARHMKLVHNKDMRPKVAFCHICNAGFSNKKMLRPHIMKVHNKVSFTCKVCDKVFRSREAYRRHVRHVHPFGDTKNRICKCDYCPESFLTELEVCRHVNLMHQQEIVGQQIESIKGEEDEKPSVKKEVVQEAYQCTKCTHTCTTWDELRSHYVKNHPAIDTSDRAASAQASETETQCQLCGELLPASGLQKHMKMKHREIDDIVCRFCNFKCNDRLAMTQHILRHKNATSLHCDFFGCKFITFYEAAMQKHKKRHDEMEFLQCTQCPFRSFNKYVLKYHEEAHVKGKRKMKCEHCDYETALAGNMQQHKNKHSAEKKYKCEICPFATKYNTSLRFHVRKKHCDLPSSS